MFVKKPLDQYKPGEEIAQVNYSYGSIHGISVYRVVKLTKLHIIVVDTTKWGDEKKYRLSNGRLVGDDSHYHPDYLEPASQEEVDEANAELVRRENERKVLRFVDKTMVSKLTDEEIQQITEILERHS